MAKIIFSKIFFFTGGTNAKEGEFNHFAAKVS
jgi:hypothetical protein